jgi:dedicator of cytokinesis protein 3
MNTGAMTTCLSGGGARKLTHFVNSAVKVFSSTRAFTKGDSEDEIWHEKSLYKTEETFPTVLRRSEIIEIQTVEISPVEIAHQDVEARTKELAALDTKYSALARTGQVVPTNALSMALNSAVDSPYEEGVPAYRQIFFDEEYLMRNPDHYDIIDRLRLAIDEHVKTIKQCLRLHKQLCSTEWLKFHETLENFFQKNFQEEIHRLGLHELPDSPSIISHELPSMIPTSSMTTLHAINLGEQYMNVPNNNNIPTIAKSGGIVDNASNGKPTLLQRHLQHLAAHGISGVSSGPMDDRGDSDSISTSPQESYINNGGSGHGNGVTNGISGAGVSGASLNTSNIGSIKGRLSRFGTLNFRRQH